MRRLGYRRDAAAAGLRRADRASASVGLIVDDVANPFFSAVHRGLEDVARSRGVLIFAGSSDDSAAQERGLVTSFSAHGVDGLVIVPAGDDHRYLERERDAGVPVVFLDRPPQRFVADAVLSDNAGGMRAAAEHLLAAGHRRIAYLGDRARVWTAAERLRRVPRDRRRRPRADESQRQRARRPTRSASCSTIPTPRPRCCAGRTGSRWARCTRCASSGGRAAIALVGFDDVPLGAPGASRSSPGPGGARPPRGRAAVRAPRRRRRPAVARIVVPTRLIARGGARSPR